MNCDITAFISDMAWRPKRAKPRFRTQMRERSLSPTVVNFNSTMDACAKAGNPQTFGCNTLFLWNSNPQTIPNNGNRWLLTSTNVQLNCTFLPLWGFPRTAVLFPAVRWAWAVIYILKINGATPSLGVRGCWCVRPWSYNVHKLRYLYYNNYNIYIYILIWIMILYIYDITP